MKIDITTLNFWIGEKILIDDIINKLTAIGFETFLENNFLNISIPHNRSNCNNVFSIINELAGQIDLKFFKKRQKSFKYKYNECNKFKILISDKNFCYFYSIAFIENFDNTKETPENIKNLLIANNINLNNFIVDMLNYASLIIGQPYHVYDATKICKTIIIDKLKTDSLFFTINNKPVKLNKECFVIKDKQNTILSLPGIIGSNFSKVTKKTTQCLIEIALFNKDTIKEIKDYYNITTLSAGIFEKGIDIHNKKIAHTFALTLLNNNNVTCKKTYIKKIKLNHKSVKLHRKKIIDILGFTINDITIEKILKSKKFNFEKFHNYWEISIPYNRYDITNEENCIAEILRYHGYNNIPMIPTKTYVNIKINTSIILKKNISTYMIHSGFNEVINYSFVNSNIERIISDNRLIFIKNPLSDQQNAMRTNLLQGLLKNVLLNINKGEKKLSFFEIGNVWPNNNYNSKLKLSCISTVMHCYNSYASEETFYMLKGMIENICTKIIKLNNLTFQYGINKYLDSNISTNIFIKNQFVGTLGLINHKLLRLFDIKEKIYFMELDLTTTLSQSQTTKFKEISKYPKIERDISFIINNTMTYNKLLSFIEKKNINNLKELNLINIYNIDDHHKSLTIRFTFQSTIKTLEDKDINKIIFDICTAAKSELSAIIKGF